MQSMARRERGQRVLLLDKSIMVDLLLTPHGECRICWVLCLGVSLSVRDSNYIQESIDDTLASSFGFVYVGT